MLQIKLIEMIRHGEEKELTASCELTFGETKVGISMWEGDFNQLKEAGLFGRSHRPNREGFRNESPMFGQIDKMNNFLHADSDETPSREFTDGF